MSNRGIVEEERRKYQLEFCAKATKFFYRLIRFISVVNSADNIAPRTVMMNNFEHFERQSVNVEYLAQKSQSESNGQSVTMRRLRRRK